jgi:hypothetical protein
MFHQALSSGYAECAKVLYPYVTNIDVIDIIDIIQSMRDDLESLTYDKNVFETLLQRYLNVMRLLVDINYAHKGDILVTEFKLFDFTYHEYQLYGNHPYYREITELVYQMGINAHHEKILKNCILSGNTGGLLLMEDLDLLHSSNMIYDIQSYSPSAGFMNVLRVFNKYHWLTDDSLTKIVSKFFSYHRFASITEEFHRILDDLTSFVIENNFHVTVNSIILKEIRDPNVMSKILNLDHDYFIFDINEQFQAASMETFQMLKSRGFNVSDPMNYTYVTWGMTGYSGAMGCTGPTGCLGCTGATGPIGPSHQMEVNYYSDM